MELTRSGFSLLSLLLLVTYLQNCTCSRTTTLIRFHDHGHDDVEDDPSLHVFFNLGDLEIGNNMSVFFARPNATASPPLLTRGEAETMPFSSSALPKLLELFSLSRTSPQAKAMDYTLKQCELETVPGESKSCATSLEAMLDFARGVLGDGHVKVLTTSLPAESTAPAPLLQNYAVLEVREVRTQRVIGCHTMPFPYMVYYCHAQERGNKVFEVSLGGPHGDTVEAIGVCHMDTSKWDRDHVSFRVLGIEPGSRPVCHFFPADNLVWVAPVSDGSVV